MTQPTNKRPTRPRTDGRTLSNVPLDDEEDALIKRAIEAQSKRLRQPVFQSVFMRNAALDAARRELGMEER